MDVLKLEEPVQLPSAECSFDPKNNSPSYIAPVHNLDDSIPTVAAGFG